MQTYFEFPQAYGRGKTIKNVIIDQTTAITDDWCVVSCS